MEFYHVLNRGVDKRNIYLDDQDRFRFIHDLFEFNDSKRLGTTSYHFYHSYGSPPQSYDVRRRKIGRRKIEGRNERRRDLLVTIHCFCLMANHYHLLLSPRKEGGIAKFMQKLNGGYAKYFNEKYRRTGTLFERRYKSILIERNPHFLYIPYYIHFNPLDLVAPEWRENKIKNYRKAAEHLGSYRWSSHLDYLGKKNLPSVTQRETLLGVFGGERAYAESIKAWLRDIDVGN